MNCPKCGHQQADGLEECIKCGVIFAKYEKIMARRAAAAAPAPPITDASSVGEPGIDEPKVIEDDDGEVQGLFGWLLDRAFYVDAPVNPVYFGGRFLVFLLLVGWGLFFIFKPMDSPYTGRSFMHLINLPFHEAGHVFFRPLGVLLMFAGGSIMQVVVPMVCLGAFIWHKNPFAASACLWWTGESLMDLAPYIADARALRLTLIGGFSGPEAVGRHDWNFILGELGMLHSDRTLAHISDKFGIILMLAAFAWGGYMLFQQFRSLDRGA